MASLHATTALSASHPIGIFDSGVGGISVLQHIHALMPHEALVYVADSRHAPYGNKTPTEITARCFAIADFLMAQGVKAIVVACNTATAAAIDAMRTKYSLPIIGMEPAVKPAAAVTQNGIIGVLATSGTLKSAQFSALLEHYGQNVKVVTQACVGLVECIERGELKNPQTIHLIQQYCHPLIREGVDTIVLGCTHYPFVKSSIQAIVGQHVHLIDTGESVAKQLQKRLSALGLVSNQQLTAEIKFWTNSQADNATQVIATLWGKATEVTVF